MGMNRQDGPDSPNSPENALGRTSGENKFDGTKLSIEGSHPKTTTGGIDWSIYMKINHREISAKLEGFRIRG